jgi:molecular chaperone Hsp33
MTDTALRAITDDGAFRVVAVRTTDTVLGASAAQGVEGDVRRLFGEVLTGAVLLRHTMAPDLRVQVILQGDDRASRMVADANPDGSARGLVQLGPGLVTGAKGMPVSKQGILKVARTLHNGSIHQGVVPVPEDGSISATLMRYMLDSEQIVSIIAVGCDVGARGELRAAGGFVLQLLPELEEGQLAIMTERMRDFEKMGPLFAKGAAEPDALVREILYGMPFSLVGTDPLRFDCNCSQARVAASLASLPKYEIQAMIDDKKVLEIGCDYCGRQYQMAPEQLRGLLAAQ